MMTAPFSADRRRLIGAAAAVSAVGLLPARKSAAAVPAGFGTLKQIRAGDLDIGYAEAGPSNGTPVLLLHGWPYDIHCYADVASILAAAGYRVIVPFLRGFGSTRFCSVQTPRNGQQSAFAMDAIALLDALGIERAVVGGCDWGARTACILAALWPARCSALVSVSGYLIGSQALGAKPLPPAAELAWWYQYYFATERGRAGYESNRKAFAELIWQTASPRWHFEPDVFARTVEAFDNPDHVAVVVHNYRWRLGLAKGEAKYDAIERRLAGFPLIATPAITLEGDANGAPHPDAATYAGKFSGPYVHRIVTGGIGHNLPQEAPESFAKAVTDASRM